MNCECGGEFILDGSWYVCQECHKVAGDFSECGESGDKCIHCGECEQEGE